MSAKGAPNFRPVDDRWMDGWRPPVPSIDPSVCFNSHIAIIIATRMQPTSTAHISIGKKGGLVLFLWDPRWWSGLVSRDEKSILKGIRAGQQHHTLYPRLGPPRTLHQSSLWTIHRLVFILIKQEAISQEKRNHKSNHHGETMIQRLIGHQCR